MRRSHERSMASFVGEAVAGAGKTTTLAVIREGAEAQGYKVEGFAPTSRAAQKLADSGTETSTLQKHLARGEKPDPGERRLYAIYRYLRDAAMIQAIAAFSTGGCRVKVVIEQGLAASQNGPVPRFHARLGLAAHLSGSQWIMLLNPVGVEHPKENRVRPKIGEQSRIWSARSSRLWLSMH